MHFICEMTSQDNLIEGSCKIMGGKSSRYVTTLASFVTKGIVIMEMFLIFHITSLDYTFKGLYEVMCGSSSR